MYFLLQTLSLAFINMAGDNIGLVPDAGTWVSSKMYGITLAAYFILGPILGGIAAWLGAKSGADIISLTNKLYGKCGRRILAYIVLGVCIPASSITGGYYAGHILAQITGLPIAVAALISIILFSVTAIGYGFEVLRISNYIAVLLMPILLYIVLGEGVDIPLNTLFSIPDDWLLVMALVGYNVQGMSAVLIIETGSCLASPKITAVTLIVMAKIIEAFFTVVILDLVIRLGGNGPFALGTVVVKSGGELLGAIFYVVSFCTLYSTMAPAMLVNVRQFQYITKSSILISTCLIGGIVYGLTYISIPILISFMGYASILMILFTAYTAYYIRK